MMKRSHKTKYRLAPGTQVREEDFGLLFYTMAGPRLYFLSSGNLLRRDFFQGKLAFDQWVEQRVDTGAVPEARISEIRTMLNRLKDKDVIVEC